jgi:hypothetical protein
LGKAVQVLEENPAFLGDEQVRLKLKHCKDLPSPPGIASRILDLSQDETASFADVADIISIDPALTAKVLRIANSPIYAKQRKIENLRQAIMVLGLNSTMMLALSFSMVSGLDNKDATRSTITSSGAAHLRLPAPAACLASSWAAKIQKISFWLAYSPTWVCSRWTRLCRVYTAPCPNCKPVIWH